MRLPACCRINYEHRRHKRFLQPTYKMPVRIVLRAMFYFVLIYAAFYAYSYICLIVVGFIWALKWLCHGRIQAEKRAIPTKQGLKRTRNQRIELSVQKA